MWLGSFHPTRPTSGAVILGQGQYACAVARDAGKLLLYTFHVRVPDERSVGLHVESTLG